MSDPLLQSPSRGESRWPVNLTVAAAITVQLMLSRDLSIQPSWLLPSVEAAILAALIAQDPTQRIQRRPRPLRLHLLLTTVLSVATIMVLWQLVDALIHGSNLSPGRLLADALVVWLSSAVVFSLWYWELDGGGPSARSFGAGDAAPDFLFPQQASPDGAQSWRPLYVDYLYLSFTNQTAFSPTDTMPLARWAKGLMGVQATLSLVIAALVISRAVNIMAG
jgi:uncharacterized membrane protein